MTMVLYSLRFPSDKIDLDSLDKISGDIIGGKGRYVTTWDYYRHRIIKDGNVDVTLGSEVYCRETFTSILRRNFLGKRKNLVGLVWCSETRGITGEILREHFVDFAAEFLTKSGVSESIVRAGTKVSKSGLGVVFPITMGDSITRFTSASALILLLRSGSVLADKKNKRIHTYSKVLENIMPRASRETGWYNEYRTTIGASTFIWYLLHFFDLHYLVSKKKRGNVSCNGPTSYFSGCRNSIISVISSFNDIPRIEMMSELLTGHKSLLNQFSTEFRAAFEVMLNKLPLKERKVKGVTL
jgi:hypothetical protein